MAEVNIGDKSSEIRRMFGLIAWRYDIANCLLSLGMDRLWRKKAVKMSQLKRNQKVLDMCCGTGDLAFSFAMHGEGLAGIACCDFSDKMIEIARDKRKKLGAAGKLGEVNFEWAVEDCTACGFDSGSFDIVSCGFGVRNMTDLNAGLGEMYRMLREGGKACILEFSLPKSKAMRWLYNFYLCWCLPLIGGIITGKYGAYRYLAKTVNKWATEVDLAKELKGAGFKSVEVKGLSCGIVTVYLAYR
jgi:demethylmenaquinone methyltransferase/2-methoxy-6-polyprenyl-1,4-benzoquinol methylase